MIKTALDATEWLLANQQPVGFDKIKSKINQAETIDQKLFFYLFAICTRWFDAKPVKVQDSSFLLARDSFGALAKWQWPTLARLYLLLLIAEKKDKEDYINFYKALFSSADVQESITLIQSLRFIPHSEAFIDNAREAARSNINSLFKAIAHNNDYAYQHFDELGWNQLILKAAFSNISLLNIYGLKARNNKQLSIMLCDYANERQAASRNIPWDLWSCVAWNADHEEIFEYLKKQFTIGDFRTKATIALALTENNNEHAAALGNKLSHVKELYELSPALTWDKIQQYEAQI